MIIKSRLAEFDYQRKNSNNAFAIIYQSCDGAWGWNIKTQVI